MSRMVLGERDWRREEGFGLGKEEGQEKVGFVGVG